jgi:phage baseplate assembly protein V
MVNLVLKMVRPLQSAIHGMINRAVVELINDAAKMQALQVSVLANETQADVERFQQYGFTSHPRKGAEAIALSLAGCREHTVIIAVDDRRYRLTGLAEGEVALYTDEGDKVHIKRGGNIKIVAAASVLIDSPSVKLSDAATLKKLMTDAMIDTYNLHTHTVAVDPGTHSGTAAPTLSVLVAATHATAKTEAA